MIPTNSQEVVLAARPIGVPQAEHFALRTAELPPLAPGQLMVRNSHLSVDPAMRGWANAGANYSEPVPVGTAMRAYAVGEVIASQNPDFHPGEVVMGMFGWRDVAVVDPGAVWRKVTETDLPRTLSLGVLGLTGLTAWAGVHRTLRPRPGGTLVVSSAAGAVGSVVGQLGARLGCRTVGIAGGPEKAARCTEEFGYDVGLDYRSPSFAEELAAATPDGVDAYFDNTSGPITDTVIRRLTLHSAMLICGTAAIHTWDPWPTGPRSERILLTQRARVEGFLAFDHFGALEQAAAELADLIREGALTYREHILHGLESAPGAINMLYSGENTGKLIIELD
jgi:NADPH-dependent curcumin reductase